MDILQIRRANLSNLIGSKRGASAEFARAHGIDATYLSQLINGHRNFGEKAARKMEFQCGLTPGFFDQQDAAQQIGTVDEIKAALNKAEWLTNETKDQIIGLILSIKG